MSETDDRLIGAAAGKIGAKLCAGRIEILKNDDGTLDEICGDDVHVHLEQMQGNKWWLCVTGDNGEARIWLQARGEIKAIIEEEP